MSENEKVFALSDSEIVEAVRFFSDNNVSERDRVKEALARNGKSLDPAKLELFTSIYLFFKFYDEKNK